MKGKKLLIVFVLILLFAAAWAAAVMAATGIQKKQEQSTLVEEADALAAKGLYVRAIPLYEEALGISTESNAQIEAKLLGSYLAHGDRHDYVMLTQTRQAKGTASEDEIINAAGMLLDSSDINESMDMITKGIETTGSQKFIDFYEENAYGYRVNRITEYETIIPAANDSLLAAYDGKYWHYIDSEFGWEADSVSYDSATAYSKEGYAAVSADGRYYVILEDGDRYGTTDEKFEDIYGVSGTHILARKNGKYSYYNFDFEPVGASYQFDAITANSCGVAAVKSDDRWGVITDSGETVIEPVLEDVAVNSLKTAFSNDVAMVKREGRWHLINTKGEDVIEATFADARAPESDQYIAVADESGKWGFIDYNGELKIPYQYQDARSFSDGMAAIMQGGRWKYISMRNTVVADEDMTEALPFHNGKAIVKKTDCMAIIRMQYVNTSKY